MRPEMHQFIEFGRFIIPRFGQSIKPFWRNEHMACATCSRSTARRSNRQAGIAHDFHQPVAFQPRHQMHFSIPIRHVKRAIGEIGVEIWCFRNVRIQIRLPER